MDDIIGRLCVTTASSRQMSAKEPALSTSITRTPRGKGQQASLQRLSAPTHMSKLRAETDSYKIITRLNAPYAKNSIVVETHRNNVYKY
jgi:hypothetical protein